ncbi:MAG TPA: hypothetical protein VK453_17755 [Micromonosporaceae bacterium]|nr:hypothetical protein [Micromonosporaceae bacterium]
MTDEEPAAAAEGEEPEPAAEGEAGPQADEADGPDEAKISTQAKDAGERRGPEQIAEVLNIFMKRAHVGTAGKSRGGGPDPRGAPTGRLEDDEVRADTEHFCRPENYDAALTRLTSDHVVALCGPAGVGKRTSAINLLREAGAGQLVVMSAISEFKGLSTRTYKEDFGYLIVNRIETSSPGDVDFAWRTVRDQVCAAGAYLVVTTVAAPEPRVDAVAQSAWQRPDLVEVVRAYLADHELSDEVVDRFVQKFDDECSMTDIVGVLTRIRNGVTAESAMERLAETSAQRVEAWFDAHCADLPAVLDVAALAFLGEVRHRDFEALRTVLDSAMRRHGVLKPATPPAKLKKSKKGEDEFTDRRRQRTSDESLITEKRVAGSASERRVLAFRTETHRRHVLAELYRRFETPFWNAAADWLTAMVENQINLDVAWGLALLSGIDFDEVEHSYLEPWSKGKIGANGQATAVCILWEMCLEENTLPAALKVAKLWANHGDPEQRWAAAMAYSGYLGACDPVQAITQLWQLAINASAGYTEACYAMASLFDTLIDRDDAGKVLSALERQLHRKQIRPRDNVAVIRARRVLSELLVLRDSKHRVPVTFRFLKKYPDRLDIVARLWAAGLCYRPHRAVVLNALWQGLNRLSHVSDKPLELASQLGEALLAALPTDEVAPFYTDLRTVESRKRERAKPERSPALVLLDVLWKYHSSRKAS